MHAKCWHVYFLDMLLTLFCEIMANGIMAKMMRWQILTREADLKHDYH